MNSLYLLLKWWELLSGASINFTQYTQQIVNSNSRPMVSTGWVAFEFSAFKLDFHSIMIRAVARALIEGGMYIHIFVLCPTNFF